MKDSWMNNPNTDKTIKAAWQALEDLGSQFKRNVDMRMKRGDVRSAIIRLLSDSPMHGYQIIHEIETRSGGAWKPSPGSIYPTLQLLLDEGLLESKESKGRRTYSLTTTGKEVAEAQADSPAPWDAEMTYPNGPRSQLGSAGVKVAKSAAEVARLGTPEQMAEAALILHQASDALNRVIKQD